MEKYIGFKMIEAEPMTDIEFNVLKKGSVTEDFAGIETQGYKVVYPDGYVSWSPRDVFEKAYMQIGYNNTITNENVEAFIKEKTVYTVGNKTTMVYVTLVNNFVICETSSCVDPLNYNEELGATICMDKIKDKIWAHLGFLLQTAKEGIK